MTSHYKTCWGGALRNNWSHCDNEFKRVMGSRQAKTVLRDKFCPACKRHGTMIPAERVAALPDGAHKLFKNSRSPGVWSVDAHGESATPCSCRLRAHLFNRSSCPSFDRESRFSGKRFRLVNNSQRDCQKPVLVVFETKSTGQHYTLAVDASTLIHCDPLPANWRLGDSVLFSVANNTLIPQQRTQVKEVVHAVVVCHGTIPSAEQSQSQAADDVRPDEQRTMPHESVSKVNRQPQIPISRSSCSAFSTPISPSSFFEPLMHPVVTTPFVGSNQAPMSCVMLLSNAPQSVQVSVPCNVVPSSGPFTLVPLSSQTTSMPICFSAQMEITPQQYATYALTPAWCSDECSDRVRATAVAGQRPHLFRTSRLR